MNSSLRFSSLNFTVLAVYLGAMLAIGLLVGRRQRTTQDFFLAGRGMPWWVVAMSMYASLTSAVTFLALPNVAYNANISLIVVCIISPLVAPVLIRVFYPIYHRLQLTTVYEYLGERFGRGARQAASGLFILARLGWLGTVVYAPALALSAVTGMPLWAAILALGAVATGYTALGGIAADIWSDVVQFFIMVVGAVWVAVALCHGVDGGHATIFAVASEAGKLDIFTWPPSIYTMSGFTVAFCFFFQLMYDYGTDQTTVQRLMTTPTQRGMTYAILFNAAVDCLIIGLLMFIGLGLFAYAGQHPAFLPAGIHGDQRLPFFIIHALPDGISGLLITAIFAAMMSSMDSGISSLSTVIVEDFVRLRRTEKVTDSADLALARWLTLLFGALATAVAFYAARFASIVEAYTAMISLFNGPILALFLLGILWKRTRFDGWLIGTAISIPATWWFQRVVEANWTWFFPFSFLAATTGTVLASLVLSGINFRPHRPTC